MPKEITRTSSKLVAIACHGPASASKPHRKRRNQWWAARPTSTLPWGEEGDMAPHPHPTALSLQDGQHRPGCAHRCTSRDCLFPGSIPDKSHDFSSPSVAQPNLTHCQVRADHGFGAETLGAEASEATGGRTEAEQANGAL